MSNNVRLWLHGLFAALIGGGASAVSGGFANILVDPKDFNIGSGGGWHLAQTMLVTFFVSGALAAFAYLKQSPLPTESVEVIEQTTKTTTVTATPTDGK